MRSSELPPPPLLGYFELLRERKEYDKPRKNKIISTILKYQEETSIFLAPTSQEQQWLFKMGAMQ